MKPLLCIAIALALVGCSTTTTTFPDGRVVKTSSQDPAVVKAITEGASKALLDAGAAELRRRNNDFK